MAGFLRELLTAPGRELPFAAVLQGDFEECTRIHFQVVGCGVSLSCSTRAGARDSSHSACAVLHWAALSRVP
jgi:hypothetical protein